MVADKVTVISKAYGSDEAWQWESSRCMPFEQEHLSDVCPCCGKPAKTMVYWGIAY